MSGRATLLDDRGRAAEDNEFFRSRPFLDAEGVTHTLRIETDEAELSSPVVVREIDGDGGRDAISPYGYPGFAARGPVPVDPEDAGLPGSGLVSAFIRHTLGPPPLSGSSARNVVQIADPELPEKSRMSDRQQIRRNERRGYEVRLVPGPSSTAADRAGFLAAYEQTMGRAEAAERYFFGAPYFDRLLEGEGSWLALASVDGEVAAASILVRSDGYLHYYLSGTADERLRDSPMKNVVAALVETSGEAGLPLNLGGGITRGDRLEEFKRGFANRETAWHTSELVCDPAAYERLSAGRTDAGFFPAYRAPA